MQLALDYKMMWSYHMEQPAPFLAQGDSQQICFSFIFFLMLNVFPKWIKI